MLAADRGDLMGVKITGIVGEKRSLPHWTLEGANFTATTTVNITAKRRSLPQSFPATTKSLVEKVEMNRYIALQNSSSSSVNKPSENAASQKISESKVCSEKQHISMLPVTSASTSNGYCRTSSKYITE
ncbi:hypothetical protein Q3G72_011026 [Acer saccharum]|nr:hypothetical protein Q3G72_011026 [Acer saccharum]